MGELRFIDPKTFDEGAHRAYHVEPNAVSNDELAEHLQAMANTQAIAAKACAAANHEPPLEHPGGPCSILDGGTRSCVRSAENAATATRTAERTLAVRIIT